MSRLEALGYKTGNEKYYVKKHDKVKGQVVGRIERIEIGRKEILFCDFAEGKGLHLVSKTHEEILAVAEIIKKRRERNGKIRE